MKFIAMLFTVLFALSCGGPGERIPTEVDLALEVKEKALSELDSINLLVDNPTAPITSGSKCKILNRISKIVKNYLAPNGGPESATKAFQTEIQEEIKDDADAKSADPVAAKTTELVEAAKGETPVPVKADPEVLAKIKTLVEKLRGKITELQGKLGGKLGEAVVAAGQYWDYLKTLGGQVASAAKDLVGPEAVNYVQQKVDAYKLKTDSSFADMLLSGLGSICEAARCQKCSKIDDFCVALTDECR